jgi:hypothetical protein
MEVAQLPRLSVCNSGMIHPFNCARGLSSVKRGVLPSEHCPTVHTDYHRRHSTIRGIQRYEGVSDTRESVQELIDLSANQENRNELRSQQITDN